jgi:hypothetical protein
VATRKPMERVATAAAAAMRRVVRIEISLESVKSQCDSKRRKRHVV